MINGSQYVRAGVGGGGKVRSGNSIESNFEFSGEIFELRIGVLVIESSKVFCVNSFEVWVVLVLKKENLNARNKTREKKDIEDK